MISRQEVRRDAFVSEFKLLSQRYTMPRAIRRQIARDIVKRAWAKRTPAMKLEGLIEEPGNLIVPAHHLPVFKKARQLGVTPSLYKDPQSGYAR